MLCSSAAARMGKELASEKGTRCLIEEHGSYANYYKRWNIPVHKNRKCENGVELGTACRFDISLSKVDREKLLRNLEKMRQQAEKPEEKMKHEHTMNFIRSSSPILS